ncbi:MAG: thioredoxin family protein [Hirschia sp.]|nr:thioredoxin family protein [Hirschia sp.]MBF18775.1 thioredoxin family protein [Hirschia sp.]
MLRMFTSIAAAITLSAPALAEAGPGKLAPAFNTTDITGANVSIPDLAGRMVVLEWTNHGCPFVKKHYNSGNMQSTQAFADDMGAVWISIVSSAPGKQGNVTPGEAMELTTSRNANPSHVVLDPTGQIGRLYGARATPHMFVVAPDGKVAYAGAIDSIPSGNPADIEHAENYVKSALTAISAGVPVKTQATQAYGCDVKYD